MLRIAVCVVALASWSLFSGARADDIPEYVDPDARHPGFTGACRYNEALNLGGTIYLADPGAHQPRFLRAAVAGDPYATVAARHPDADACEGELGDGASTYLEPGAALHAVDDWSPTFRLVSVQPSDRLVLYQAHFSTTARFAGDYLDLRDRGPSVTLIPPDDCPDNAICVIPAAPPLPRDRPDALIESILAGRIDPTAIDHSSSHLNAHGMFSVAADLPDQTSLRFTFVCGSMTSTTGIVLPDDAFTDAELRYLCPEDDAVAS